ncbi:AMP-binding protein [Derxia gummosa]|uniref:AMP-binding protein n=1 Tax=Derxia gummosa DSM 723 TaxID=1121388 RepID=A0A8B6X5A1_9BURK|nr:AMP-binding protein [Derxia gummosa]
MSSRVEAGAARGADDARAAAPVAPRAASRVTPDGFWRRLRESDGRGIHVMTEGAPEPVFLPYTRLAADAPRMAALLREVGIGRGDAVLLCAETTPHFPLVWLGLMWLGATPVPLPPRNALANAGRFEERIGPILPWFGVYLHGAGDATVLRALAAELAPALRLVEIGELVARLGKGAPPAAADLPDAAACIVANTLTEPANAACYHELDIDIGDFAAQSEQPADLADDDIAFIQFTSGSTSAPKGIRVTQANLRANLDAIGARLDLGPERDCMVSWLPLYHDMGLIGKFLMSLHTAMPLVLMPPAMFVRRPLHLLALIERHRGTICSMPNFGYDLLLRRAASGKAVPHLGSMRWFGVGAEPVRLATVAGFEGVFGAHGLREGVVSPCYGLAEATLAVSIEAPFDGYRSLRRGDRCHVTCGPLVDGFEVRLREGDGALLIRGPSVARTALVAGEVKPIVDAEGFYDTRDMAEIVDGRLVILGRTDEMFVINGENWFPYDIEAVVRDACADVQRVACIQLPHAAGEEGHGVTLFYERRGAGGGAGGDAGASAAAAGIGAATGTSAADAARELRIRQLLLERFALPVREVVALDGKTIPVTPSGKIQRVRLRALHEQLRTAAARPREESPA